MTDTRNRARRDKDEATLDLFEAAETQASGQTDMKAAKTPAQGKKAKKGKEGPVAGAGRGGRYASA